MTISFFPLSLYVRIPKILPPLHLTLAAPQTLLTAVSISSRIELFPFSQEIVVHQRIQKSYLTKNN
jgi:hypothetical protein